LFRLSVGGSSSGLPGTFGWWFACGFVDFVSSSLVVAHGSAQHTLWFFTQLSSHNHNTISITSFSITKIISTRFDTCLEQIFVSRTTFRENWSEPNLSIFGKKLKNFVHETLWQLMFMNMNFLLCISAIISTVGELAIYFDFSILVFYLKNW